VPWVILIAYLAESKRQKEKRKKIASSRSASCFFAFASSQIPWEEKGKKKTIKTES